MLLRQTEMKTTKNPRNVSFCTLCLNFSTTFSNDWCVTLVIRIAAWVLSTLNMPGDPTKQVKETSTVHQNHQTPLLQSLVLQHHQHLLRCSVEQSISLVAADFALNVDNLCLYQEPQIIRLTWTKACNYYGHMSKVLGLLQCSVTYYSASLCSCIIHTKH